MFCLTRFFQLLACLLPKYEHKGAPEGFFSVLFCLPFLLPKKKSVSGSVQVGSGWDLWLKWIAKDYSSFFFMASPLQRTTSGCITPWGTFPAVTTSHVGSRWFRGGPGHVRGVVRLLCCCAGACAQLQVWGQSSHWDVCSPLQPRQRLLWSSAGHRAGCINIFMLFYSPKKQNYDVLKLLIYCSWLQHCCCVISQKTILGSPILLLLMSRRKIPFTAVIQKQEGADAGKKFIWKLSQRGRECVEGTIE